VTDGSTPRRPMTVEALRGDLLDVWASLGVLLDGLDTEDFTAPTDCPGWNVADVVAHVIGTELMLSGIDAPDVEVPDAPHLRNDIARMNETWIVARRELTPEALVAEFHDVVRSRSEALDALTQAEVDAESWTPAGHATLGRFLQIRVFDTWIHEQDIRLAIGQVGHETGNAVVRSLAEVALGIGFVVGKRAGLTDGQSVRIELPGPQPAQYDVLVADGRASVVDGMPDEPTTTLTTDSSLFVRLVAGRQDPIAALEAGLVTVGGDVALGERVVAALPYTI
jgi:uncharacterized protein (TIGR03083 family)